MGKSKNKNRHSWIKENDFDVCTKCRMKKSRGNLSITHYYNQKGDQIATKAPECEKQI